MYRTAGCVLVCVLWAGAGVARAADGNLLKPGGFEKWADGQPAGWQSEQAARVTDKAHVHGGRAALRLKPVKDSRGYIADLVLADRVFIKPGKLYRVRLWAKGMGRMSLSVSAHGRGKAGRSNANYVALTDDWAMYQFFYGVVEDRFKRLHISFRVDASQINYRRNPDRLVAYLDDVTIEAVGKAEGLGPDVMPNGKMELDADRDGRPDKWGVVLPMKPPHAVGPDGSRALACFGGSDPTPKKLALEPATWWDATRKRQTPSPWASPATSPVFPIEPGRSYRLTMQTAGRNVNRLLCRLAWVTTDGKPLGIRVDVRTPRRHGTWDWETDIMDFTAPTGRVKGAKVLFRTHAAGGWIWVDNVSVRAINTQAVGYRVPLPFKTEAAKITRSALAVPAPKPPKREIKGIEFTASSQSRVVLRHGEIAIDLASGVWLRFSEQAKSLMGIDEVRLGNLQLRNREAPPLAPLVKTAGGRRHVACTYKGNDVAPDGTVTIHTLLRSADGKEDQLDWIFKPVQREIGGQPYVGFAYGFRVRSAGDVVHDIIDRSTWELGGKAEGVTVVTQMAYTLDNMFTISPEVVYAGQSHYRFAHGDGLDYQFAAEGGLAVFYDEKAARMETHREATLAWIRYYDTTPFVGGADVRTPLKCVLYCRKGDHDEWTRARDYVLSRFAAYWGAKMDTPMPYISGLMTRRQQNVENKGRFFQVVADELVPKIAPLGFKVIWAGTLSGHKGLGMYKLEPAGVYGGMEGLVYLRNKAAAAGLRMQCWGPTARVSQVSPLFREHPEWLLKGPGGRPPTGYSYPTTRACRLRSGWMDYGLKRYTAIRDESGLDCLWLDSYASYTLAPSFDSRKEMLEQAEDLFTWHGKLNRLGYAIYTEASGTLGIPSPGFPEGNPHSPKPALPDPRTRYMLAGHTGGYDRPGVQALHRMFTQTDYYYRLLANKGPCMVNWLLIKDDEAGRARIARHNKDYNAVVDRMVWRHTLPDDRGVEWTDPKRPDTRILFSYKQAAFTRPGIKAVHCVTTDRAVKLQRGGFTAEPEHTYRVSF